MGKSEKKRHRSDPSATPEKKSKKSKNSKNSKNSRLPAPSSAAAVPVVPAAAAAALPSNAPVRSLPPAAQDHFLTATAAFCERALRALHAGATSLHAHPAADAAAAAAHNAAAVEDIVLADMARLRSVPLARNFTDITLWRRLRTANTRVVASVDAACDAVEGPTKSGRQGQEPKVGRSAGTLSFRNTRMQSLTQRFAGELGKLHETEQMGSERVAFLLRCLEEGADIFAGLFDDGGKS